ncbi:putative minor silk ampullate protein [Janthinobacterium sp. CG23_2]|nr:putative minor silk ampullate protein [Janthinobacterium sp. CG23_2]CUU33208.1 putative minor silk ampullate protein [Janthinobacterium sp. CG23_2]
MGLLDMFNDPQSAGLLGAGAQILERSGDTSRPYGIGQAMGTGINTYMQTNAAMRARKLQEAQEAQQQAMRDIQMKEMQAELAQKQSTQAEKQRLQDFFTKRQTGGAQLPQPGGQGQQSMPAAMQGGQQPGAAPQQFAPGGAGASTPYAERMQLADELRHAGFQSQADAQETSALKFQPKVKEWAKVNVSGKVMFAPLFEGGGHGEPVPLEVAEKLHFGDNGQNLVGMDQYTGKVKSSIGKQQTLESIASERSAAAGRAVTMRGQNMGDARQREMAEITRQGQQTQIINDPMSGPLLIDKGTGRARQAIGMDGQPIRGEQTIKKEKQAQGLVSVIDSAEKLLDGATGSTLGASYDATKQFFGGTTEGSRNIAQLKVLEGSIMMNQPRMEGPQSDKDVALYRQMAGQIGDPAVPAALKKVALQSIKEINQRYAGGAQQQPAAQAAQPMRKSVLRGQVIDGYRFKGGDPSDQNNWERK